MLMVKTGPLCNIINPLLGNKLNTSNVTMRKVIKIRLYGIRLNSHQRMILYHLFSDTLT